MKFKNYLGKKGDVLQNWSLLLFSTILLLVAVFSGVSVSKKAGFNLGDHPKEIFSVTNYAKLNQSFIDEAARQSAIDSLYYVSVDLSEDCEDYLKYSTIFSKGQFCLTDLNNRFQSSLFSRFYDISSEQKQSYFLSLNKKTDSFTFLGVKKDQDLVEQNDVKYYYRKSFEINVDYDLNDFEKVTSFIADVSSCNAFEGAKFEECIANFISKDSTKNLKFNLGNCEDYPFFSSVEEQLSACLDSSNNNCFCNISLAKNPLYDLKLDSVDGAIIAKLNGKDEGVAEFTIEGATFLKGFKTSFDGSNLYLRKSGKMLAAPTEAVSTQEICMPKKIYRFCAVSDKKFYFFTNDQKIVKDNLKYKFAFDFS